jgi:hypothetical protein
MSKAIFTLSSFTEISPTGSLFQSSPSRPRGRLFFWNPHPRPLSSNAERRVDVVLAHGRLCGGAGSDAKAQKVLGKSNYAANQPAALECAVI